MASSSSSVRNKSYQYDVFLSFCGEDTRKTFVDHLYVALDQQGICTFKDDERLEKGKKINDELLQSIEDSRLCIIVFSKSYASSSWCLNELLKIMECHKSNEQTAFPVFYDVDPSEVRKQTGSVEAALAIHKNEAEVGKWKQALKKAADLSGWDVRKTANGHEAKVIKLIVQRVSLELRYINMDVDENLVGMEQRMENLNSCLEVGTNDVRMIGIKGMGGAGKTTLAWAIFNKISMNFEGKSFVENVREKASKFGLKKLQKQVLRDVKMDKDLTVSGVREGENLMKNRLRGTKVLVVLDDVDDINQLKMLAGDTTWFKPGSRIIITTREGQVLEAHKVKWIHDVNLLSDKEAICLFSRHAFAKDIPTQEYERYSREVVIYAAGLPLTIKVLGSDLCGKDASEWTNTLERLKEIPLKETLKILELSYINLENDHKEIFLDVACFLRGKMKDYGIRMLESCGFFAKHGLKVLEQKSLIVTLERRGDTIIDMHDHLVEMGKNIVRREHPNEPNKHSRLWIQEEIEHALAGNSGSEAVKCIDLKITPSIFVEGLANMKKLRCLIVNSKKYNFSHGGRWYFFGRSWKHDKARRCFPTSLQYLHWSDYPYRCLPKMFEANNLVTLVMPDSKIKQLWKGEKVTMKNLKYLDLSCSKKLRRLDLGLTPNLERLNLEGCDDLVKLDVHGGCLKSLVYLNLRWCTSLKSISFIKQFESLEVLHIGGLNLKEFPDCIFTGHSINSLIELHLSYNRNIEEVPSSIGNLHKLVSLDISRCYGLKELPSSIGNLHKLVSLDISYCLDLKELPSSIGNLHKLVSLDISDCRNLKELPSSIGNLHKLVSLNLNGCWNIKSLPGSICSLQHLRTLNLNSTGIKELSEDLGQLECLENLYLTYTHVKHLPGSICMLKHLKTLLLSSCRFLEYLPEDVGQLESLEILDLHGCPNLRELPNSICKLKCLKELKLFGCRRLEKLPDELGDLKRLQVLDVRETGITHLPQSISLLKGLKIGRSELKDDDDDDDDDDELHLRDTDVKHLPNSICMLKHLKKLILQRCVLLEKLPDDVGQIESLEELKLSRCYSIREIPSSTCMLKQLKVLNLYHCFCLERLPDDVGQLECLEELYITRCYNIREIPSSIRMLKHLKKLDLEGCRRLEKMPDELGELESLQLLVIWDTGISHLPHSISLVNGLKIYGFLSHTKSAAPFQVPS